MLFNSIDYFLFLAAAVFLVQVWRNSRFQVGYLLLASYLFYSIYHPWFVLLLLGVSLAAYLLGISLPRFRSRALYVAACVVCSFAALCYFKYSAFVLDLLEPILHADTQAWAYNAMLPIGISFFSFQAYGYLWDVYRGNAEPERNIFRFLLFLSFFPQLVAGPIERAEHLLPQLPSAKPLTPSRFSGGVKLICWGLVKKVVIADRLSVLVDVAFNNPGAFSAPFCMLANVGFAFQIYYDFSGYTDIALGSAQLLGVDLMDNFDRPYFSRNIAEFWRRWHLSLYSWFRDYVYIPLGGSKTGLKRNLGNILFVFGISGLWHGAGLNFIAWGLLHGLYIAAYVLYRRVTPVAAFRFGRAWTVLGWLATFSLVCVTWVFFRARNIEAALVYIANEFKVFTMADVLAVCDVVIDSTWLAQPDLLVILLGIPCIELVEQIQSKASRRFFFETHHPLVRYAFGLVLFLSLVNLGYSIDMPFIYFDF